ncbi:efflux RND transporter periplasmic adaptor subunit [Candidatus Uhrbacteria bacterium]|nr:efflux RND transporter periplasmic adaptor subunit [Candidatus Uhrbacteria bacterium]
MTTILSRNVVRAIGLITIGIIGLCGIGFAATKLQKTEAITESKPTQIPAIPVHVRTANDSRESIENVVYPGTIVSENEAIVIAKTNGTASNLKFNIGDKVTLGQDLVKIDDITSNGTSGASGFSANQVKQAEAAVQQALVSLQLSRNSYATVLQTANRDINQAEIAANQSTTAQQNLKITTDENLKSAGLALETAKIATEQSRIALENRQKVSVQSVKDTDANTKVSINTAVDTSGAVIASINVATGVETDKGGMLAYRDQLGALDSQSSQIAHQKYIDAIQALNTYRKTNFPDFSTQIEAATSLINKTKELTDATRHMLDKTIPSSQLPQTTLAQIQTQIIGYQAQMNGALTQLNQAKQSITNTGLNNDSILDGLKKAYEIAQQQEQSAAQSVANLKASNLSQIDVAGYSVQSANNQLVSTKSRTSGQISSANSQVNLAEIQYNNAIIALQNVTDAHRAISPITGVVISKNVSNGDTVSQGQILATVGTPDRLKATFFIDQESLSMIAVGQQVELISSDSFVASGTIISISPQADAATRRYQIEIHPNVSDTTHFPLGSILDIKVPLKKIASNQNILLPLNAIDVTQNGNFINIVKDGKAHIVKVEIIRIMGETAEVKGDVQSNDMIIIDGNRLTSEGSIVTIIQ